MGVDEAGLRKLWDGTLFPKASGQEYEKAEFVGERDEGIQNYG